MIGTYVRGVLFPMRWGVAKLPRGSWLRSACVPALKAASRRRWLLKSLAEIRPIDRPDLSFEPTDSWVMDEVYWFGVQGYEGVLAETWARLCQGARSVLEIGGNIGFYSVVGAKTSRGVYTVVEPVPQVVTVLRANLRRNGLERVEVLRGAAIPDEKRGLVALNVSDEGRAAPTGAHLMNGVEIGRRHSSGQLLVEGFPVMQLVQGRDLIKIDAEGIEHALLRASMRHLVQHGPTIVVEVLPGSNQLIDVIRELGTVAGYVVNIVPGYGSDRIVAVSAAQFDAELPPRFHSKDVILARQPIN
jgi:FkbM family methyltransferase